MDKSFLSVRQLAYKLGYHEESVRRRIRQLRSAGRVRDIGFIPATYQDQDSDENGGGEFEGLTLVWLHPQFFIIKPDFPGELFPGKGKSEESNDN